MSQNSSVTYNPNFMNAFEVFHAVSGSHISTAQTAPWNLQIINIVFFFFYLLTTLPMSHILLYKVEENLSQAFVTDIYTKQLLQKSNANSVNEKFKHCKKKE